MATKQTEKCSFKSKYGDSWITPAQYIIERLCEKKAESEKVHLPVEFWNVPKWDNYYKQNLRKVYSLLKHYSDRAILNALNSKEMSNRYSIFTPFAEDIIKREQKILDTAKSASRVDINRNTLNSKPRQVSKSNALSKLKELDE